MGKEKLGCRRYRNICEHYTSHVLHIAYMMSPICVTRARQCCYFKKKKKNYIIKIEYVTVFSNAGCYVVPSESSLEIHCRWRFFFQAFTQVDNNG